MLHRGNTNSPTHVSAPPRRTRQRAGYRGDVARPRSDAHVLELNRLPAADGAEAIKDDVLGLTVAPPATHEREAGLGVGRVGEQRRAFAVIEDGRCHAAEVATRTRRWMTRNACIAGHAAPRNSYSPS